MSAQAITFRDMLAPVTAEAFFERHYDSKPLHVTGGGEKFAPVFSWPALNALLNMPNVWTARTVKIVRDDITLPAEHFCRPVYGREGQTVMEADPVQVRRYLREGATIVLDFVECLSPANPRMIRLITEMAAAGLAAREAERQLSAESPDQQRSYAA